jgi:hypothetical protein
MALSMVSKPSHASLRRLSSSANPTGHGTAGNNLDHRADLQGFPLATPTQPFASAFQAIPSMKRVQTGFDEKYERGCNSSIQSTRIR